jgi:hypothetical protein
LTLTYETRNIDLSEVVAKQKPLGIQSERDGVEEVGLDLDLCEVNFKSF